MMQLAPDAGSAAGSTATARFCQLVDMLSWPEHSTIMSELWAHYVEQLCGRLGQVLGDISLYDEREGDKLVQQMRQLGDEALFRFVTAPETSNRILHTPEGQHRNIAFYAEAMTAEYSGRDAPRTRACWTAHGDRYYAEARCRPTKSWRSDRDYRAPVLSHGVPVDHTSPLVRTLDSMPGMFEPLSPAELARNLQDLEVAVEGVGATSQSALDFITIFTRVVLLRRDPSSPRQFGSSSTSTHIGRSAFGNPQLGDAVLFANGFVHEAIHTAFYIAELDTPMVVDRTYAEVKIESPWTGNSLRLRTFLHACMVWFGLYKFWRRALVVRSFPETKAFEQLRRAATGFLSADLGDLLEPSKLAVSPLALTSIRHLQQEVLTDANP